MKNIANNQFFTISRPDGWLAEIKHKLVTQVVKAPLIAMATIRSSASGFLSIFIAAVGLSICPAQAAPLAFTNEADWLAALGGSGVVTEDFESSPIGPLPLGSTDIGLFDVSLNAVDTNGLTEILDPGFVNGTRDLRGSVYDDLATGPTQIAFIFGAAVRGVAGDFFDATSADSLTITISGVTFNVVDHLGVPGNGFLGFVDNDPFTQIIFGTQNAAVQPNEAFNVDNVRISPASTVPEPPTMALLAAGIMILGWKRWRTYLRGGA